MTGPHSHLADLDLHGEATKSTERNQRHSRPGLRGLGTPSGRNSAPGDPGRAPARAPGGAHRGPQPRAGARRRRRRSSQDQHLPWRSTGKVTRAGKTAGWRILVSWAGQFGDGRLAEQPTGNSSHPFAQARMRIASAGTLLGAEPFDSFWSMIFQFKDGVCLEFALHSSTVFKVCVTGDLIKISNQLQAWLQVRPKFRPSAFFFKRSWYLQA